MITTLPYIPELIDRKTSGPEKGRLHQEDLAFYEREYQRLLAELELAYHESQLPDSASAAAAMHDLLVKVRLTS